MVTNGIPAQKFSLGVRQTIANAADVLDIGAFSRFGKELSPLRTFFDGKRYIAAAYNPKMVYGADNADCHQDIEAMTFKDASFDAVICIEVLEHVQRPWLAAEEIWRVLRPGGRLMVTTPFIHGFHGKGGKDQSQENYPDYWRYTHQGLELLFNRFSTLSVTPLHGPLEARLVSLKLLGLIKFRPVRWLVDRGERPSPNFAQRFMTLGVK
jgi:SAM-dependent methyltransferase